MLLFCCSWFKYRFIKVDLVKVRKFSFHFSCVPGSLVDYVNVKLRARVAVNHALRDALNTKKSRHRPQLKPLVFGSSRN